MIVVQPNSRLVGYARVSTNEQELNLQTDALLQHGVNKEHLFCDKISGAKEDRPGLTACNELSREGDTLVVWRLDRLGRSMTRMTSSRFKTAFITPIISPSSSSTRKQISIDWMLALPSNSISPM